MSSGNIPAMILGNCPLFPGVLLPLRIFEPRYRCMLSKVLEGDRMFGVAEQNPFEDQESPLPMMGVGVVRFCRTLEDGTSVLFLQGMKTHRILRTSVGTPYPCFVTRELNLNGGCKSEDLFDFRENLLRLAGLLAPAKPVPTLQYLVDQEPVLVQGPNVQDVAQRLSCMSDLANFLACTLLQDPLQRQAFMAEETLPRRLALLDQLLRQDLRELTGQDDCEHED